MSIIRELEPLKVCIFGQWIEIEKLASRIYNIVSPNRPVFKLINSLLKQRQISCQTYLFLQHKIHKVHEIYKVTKLHYIMKKMMSISIFDMFDKVNLMGMHLISQFADSSFHDAIQEF